MKNIVFSMTLLIIASGCASVTIDENAIRDAQIKSIEIVTSQDKLELDVNNNEAQSLLGVVVKAVAQVGINSKTNALNEKLDGYDLRSDTVDKVVESFDMENVQLIETTKAAGNTIRLRDGVPQLGLSYKISNLYTYIQVDGALRYKVAGQSSHYWSRYVSRIDLETFGVKGSKNEKYKYLLENPESLRAALETSAKNITTMFYEDLRGVGADSTPVETAKFPKTNAGKWGATTTLPIVDERDGYLHLGPSDSKNIRAIISPSIVLKRKKIE